MRGAAGVGVVLAAVVAIAACSSSRPGASSGPPSRAVSSTAAGHPTGSAPTTTPPLTPTAYNCGAAAYEPATLLIVCGVDTTMATGVKWADWTSTGASGQGEVAVTGRPAHAASLRLGSVLATGSGPQFSLLTVTWTGSSPDGHSTDTFRLATASS